MVQCSLSTNPTEGKPMCIIYSEGKAALLVKTQINNLYYQSLKFKTWYVKEVILLKKTTNLELFIFPITE